MTEQQMRARRKQAQLQRKRIQQRKRKMQWFVWIELTVIIALVSFICGKKAGEAKASIAQENMQSYASSNQQGAVGGVLEEQDNDSKLDKNSWKDHPELVLVNKENKLPEEYPINLKTLPDGKNKSNDIAYDAICDFLKAGRKAGMNLEVCSSYRSVERQQELLDEDVNDLMAKGYSYKDAYAEVTRETMPPGYSEHSTGLAFDIVALSYQMLDSEQAKTKENKWLLEHCAEFGFILRYPEDKEDITGISYESWHFRYVGKEVAEEIMEKGITLEEYFK